MPQFDWYHYYVLAVELDDSVNDVPVNQLSETDIATIRTCVSRTYYAAHWLCRNYLKRKKHEHIPKEKCHSITVTELAKYDEATSDELDNLLSRRVDADYELQKSFSKRDISESIRKYKVIKTAIEDLWQKP